MYRRCLVAAAEGRPSRQIGHQRPYRATHIRAFVEDGVVVNVVVGGGGYQEGIYSGPNVQIGRSYDGTTFSPPPPPEPEPLTVEDYRVTIQSHVDEAARDRRYDSGVSFASYVASTDPVWSAEAQIFVAWRDAVWLYAYAELDKVMAGEREAPTVDAFISELPAVAWGEVA